MWGKCERAPLEICSVQAGLVLLTGLMLTAMWVYTASHQRPDGAEIGAQLIHR